MKTFRGFPLKSNVGIGLQNHFDRKKTHAPTQFSKWGGFRDKDWDFLDNEFYSKDGKNHTEADQDVKEDRMDDCQTLSKKSTKNNSKVAPRNSIPVYKAQIAKKLKNDFEKTDSMETCPRTPIETMSSMKEVKKISPQDQKIN